VDLVATLRREIPEGVELSNLCGQIVWLRDATHEWTGPVEEALDLLRAGDPARGFWAAFAPSEAA
jgi:hypothetical protein